MTAGHGKDKITRMYIMTRGRGKWGKKIGKKEESY